jgi:peptide/nickel transport system substrate-binding protein
MKRFNLLLLVASSLFSSVSALAAERPHYGGSLRIEMREAPQNLDPAAQATPGLQSLARLVFETLVSLDDRGRPQPLLASSWQPEPGNQRWRFTLRNGVSFSDGSALDANAVGASLRNGNPNWKITAMSDSVIIETEAPDPELAAELALARNSIVRRTTGTPIGTGPFTIRELNAGKRVTLVANEQYWTGRPFLDEIEVGFAKNDREQMIEFDLGKADVVEIAAENIRRAQAENRNVVASNPSQLIALVFASEPRSEDEAHARNLLAASVDKASLNNVVLQSGGEPAEALLPNWASGYEFVFASSEASHSPAHAAQRSNQTWKLSFDASDSVARVVAQRLALNARDAGITLDLSGSAPADLRLVRVELASIDPHVALMELAQALQLSLPKFGGASIADLYAAEKTLLQSHRIIPLLHLQEAVALRPEIQDFGMSPDAMWHLENVWLSAEKP